MNRTGDMVSERRPRNWVAALRGFAAEPAVEERCELCSASLASEHAHLVEPAKRRLVCACEPCAILFSERDDGRYRRVPRQARRLSEFAMSDAQWDALFIPIGLAFAFYSTPDRRVIALYPGAAGAAESQLELRAWEDLTAANPVLATFEPDVEALLINRINGAREYYRLPIDRCYALVGLIRSHWHGLSGGTEAWTAIEDFFSSLRESTSSPEVRVHA